MKDVIWVIYYTHESTGDGGFFSHVASNLKPIHGSWKSALNEVLENAPMSERKKYEVRQYKRYYDA